MHTRVYTVYSQNSANQLKQEEKIFRSHSKLKQLQSELTLCGHKIINIQLIHELLLQTDAWIGYVQSGDSKIKIVITHSYQS